MCCIACSRSVAWGGAGVGADASQGEGGAGGGETLLRCIVPLEGRTCGLLPLGGPVAAVTTRGLRWDVSDWATRFGGAISSSNRLAAYDDDGAEVGSSIGKSFGKFGAVVRDNDAD